MHQIVEELFCLAMGLGLAECQLPREMWSMFPGGMPYYVINVGLTIRQSLVFACLVGNEQQAIILLFIKL